MPTIVQTPLREHQGAEKLIASVGSRRKPPPPDIKDFKQSLLGRSAQNWHHTENESVELDNRAVH